MAVVAEVQEEAQQPPAHEEPQRPAMNQVGLWLFFFSESFLFAALATPRFVLAGTDRPEELNQGLGLGITSVLLLSSLTAYRAESAIAQGDRANFTRNLLATILLGLVFVFGVGAEWITAEFDVSEPYGTASSSTPGLRTPFI